jgi:DNA-binding LacI/PurR family transcriptional regulator
MAVRRELKDSAMNNMNFNLFVEKILSDVAPKQSGKAVFIFGRMNPPTLGHELLISKAVEVSRKERADCYVILSKTQDKKKNPIPYDHKINAINAALPNVNFIDSDNIKTIFDAVQFLIDKGYTDLTLVCGSDRAAEYDALFNKYINNPDPEKRLNLTSFKTAVAGENRDPDSDDASGVSATKARNLAKAGDFDTFKKILPTGMPEDQAEVLYNDIRQNLK